MKFVLAKEHHDFFDKEGFIVFEDLLSHASLEKLKQAVKQLLASRLKTPADRLLRESPSRLYNAGRDLWRKHPDIQKVAANRNFASVAAALSRQTPIRLALDQWIPQNFNVEGINTLEDLVPVQGLIAGAFIALDAAIDPIDPSFFPTEAGQVLFVNPNTPLPLHEISESRKQNFLLVVYSAKNSVYIHKETDPLTHYLKEFHYVYGDRLSDSLHPILLLR